MATRAFILIETSVGKTKEVVTSMRKMAGISSVQAVTGPFDVITTVEAEDLNGIGEIVTNYIHTIPGIVRTTTCLVVPL